MNNKLITAYNAGLIACRICHTLVKAPDSMTRKHLHCPTCGNPISSRKKRSIEKTWALLIAAAAFYVPANTLPIMSTVYFGQGQSNTILSGVIELAAEGFWPLAVIVFIASIVVPISKLLILSVLVLSVQYKSRWRPLDRARIYRITEFVGRWSMVDIFVIAILVALVQFGSIASVQAGAGSLSFAAVIILTMFAANTFDPRLIWDAMEHPND